MPDNLTNRNGQWVEGCGCGGKPIKTIESPPNSKSVLLRLVGTHVGPVSGITYNMMPHQVAIDIDQRDADHWLASGVAHQPVQGQKGRTARVPTNT